MQSRSCDDPLFHICLTKAIYTNNSTLLKQTYIWKSFAIHKAYCTQCDSQTVPATVCFKVKRMNVDCQGDRRRGRQAPGRNGWIRTSVRQMASFANPSTSSTVSWSCTTQFSTSLRTRTHNAISTATSEHHFSIQTFVNKHWMVYQNTSKDVLFFQKPFQFFQSRKTLIGLSVFLKQWLEAHNAWKATLERTSWHFGK